MHTQVRTHTARWSNRCQRSHTAVEGQKWVLFVEIREGCTVQQPPPHSHHSWRFVYASKRGRTHTEHSDTLQFVVEGMAARGQVDRHAGLAQLSMLATELLPWGPPLDSSISPLWHNRPGSAAGHVAGGHRSWCHAYDERTGGATHKGRARKKSHHNEGTRHKSGRKRAPSSSSTEGVVGNRPAARWACMCSCIWWL